MQISREHLAGKPQKIGTLDGDPVYEIVTTGGLNLVSVTRHGKVEMLGVGPHKAIARFLAQKKEPDLVYTSLTKADYVPVEEFPELIAKYEQLTDDFRRVQGLK